MNFDLSETQELFQSTTERFTQSIDVTARTKIRSEPNGYDRSRWAELCELGLLAAAASEDQGGLGGSLTDLNVIAEAIGTNNGLDPWLENGAFPIRLLCSAENSDVQNGREAQTALLETLIDGSQIVAVAFIEPSSRFDLAPHDTSAAKLENDAGFLLNGMKHLVLGGAIADLLLVTALCDDEFSIFCVPVNTPGIETQAYKLADGSIGTSVSFSDVSLPITAKLDLSFAQFQNTVTEISVLCCSEMLGLSQLLLNDTLAYVKERKQFNVPIGSFQVIQHGLVDCYSNLEQMRALLLRTLIVDEDSESNWQANVMGTKSFISDTANSIAKHAVQYHGAMGITDEVAIGHAYKRILLLSRLFGDSSDNLKQYMESI